MSKTSATNGAEPITTKSRRNFADTIRSQITRLPCENPLRTSGNERLQPVFLFVSKALPSFLPQAKDAISYHHNVPFGRPHRAPENCRNGGFESRAIVCIAVEVVESLQIEYGSLHLYVKIRSAPWGCDVESAIVR